MCKNFYIAGKEPCTGSGKDMIQMEECFYIIQKCLILIPSVVENLRKQYYFHGTNEFKELVSGLTKVSDFVLERTEYKDVFLTVLQEILQQQEKQDYVLLADVLENDLRPLLQEIQSVVINAEKIDIVCCWEKNLLSIKKKNLSLYQKLSDIKDDDLIGLQVSFALNGQPTLAYEKNGEMYYMHSTINPEWEGRLFIEPYRAREEHIFYIYGMGLGYHVLSVLQQSPFNKVIVLEKNVQILREALEIQDLSLYLAQGRLEIFCDKDIINLLSKIEKHRERLLLIHYPSLMMMEKSQERDLLENYFITSSSMMEQKRKLDENFVQIQKENFPEVEELKDLFFENTVVLVAGGPSVDLELETLRRVQHNTVILAVGTIAKKLLVNGVRPDAIILSDPQEKAGKQIIGLDEDIPLLLLSTAVYSAAQAYPGPIYVIYQEGYSHAEKVAEQNQYKLFSTGGSVTTTALDVCLQMGANRIILVGTDMAYTNGYSHASGVGTKISENVELKEVEAVGGGTVRTIRNLNIYRLWIEKRIQEYKNVTIYNTAKGARIHGTIEDCLENIMNGNV